MKALVVGMSVLMALPAFAQSQKICFGSGPDRGNRIGLVLNGTAAQIPFVSGSEVQTFRGQYAFAGTLKGQDGKNYLAYSMGALGGGHGGDQGELLVDEALLKPGTVGLAKIRSRADHGIYQNTFFCKDAQ